MPLDEGEKKYIVEREEKDVEDLMNTLTVKRKKILKDVDTLKKNSVLPLIVFIDQCYGLKKTLGDTALISSVITLLMNFKNIDESLKILNKAKEQIIKLDKQLSKREDN